MNKKPVAVLVLLKAKPGKVNQVRSELIALVGPSRADKGCINYDLHQGVDDKTQFLFYENWSSTDELDRHTDTPHVRAFMAMQDELLAGPAELTSWEELD